MRAFLIRQKIRYAEDNYFKPRRLEEEKVEPQSKDVEIGDSLTYEIKHFLGVNEAGTLNDKTPKF